MSAQTRTRIKICGLTRIQDVHAAIEAGADAIGFVLYEKSPRFVTPENAAKMARALPPFVTPVLLFVNATLSEVVRAAHLIPSATLQFHGDETPEFCDAASLACHRNYIRAARIPADQANGFDFAQFGRDYSLAIAWLLDTHSPNFGGNGAIFSWHDLPPHLPAHIILAGGLNAENVGSGITALRGRGLSLTVDVSSGVEAIAADGFDKKGIKDSDKIRRFIDLVRQYNP
jgi:phosphoribosylanthranilate isomerase